MSHRESWECRGLPPVDPLAVPPRSGDSFILPWAMVAIAVSLIGYLVYAWHEQGVEVVIRNPMAVIAPEDPNLTIVRKWFAENLDNPDYEIVRVWGPLSCKQTLRKWIMDRRESDAEYLQRARVSGQNDFVQELLKDQEEDVKGIVAKGTPLLIRVKYRAHNIVGAMMLWDRVFQIKNGKVHEVLLWDEWEGRLAANDAAVLNAD